jgi:hypothetical protein
MCLRFGSDPRRDFLSTATPQRKDIPVTERQDVPAEATGDIDQPKHFRQLNCSNTPAIDCGTVKQ